MGGGRRRGKYGGREGKREGGKDGGKETECTKAYMQRSKSTTMDFVLSFHFYVSSRDQT